MGRGREKYVVLLGIYSQVTHSPFDSFVVRQEDTSRFVSQHILTFHLLILILQQVAEAARIALEKYRKEHADEGDVSLDIEMPEAPPDAAGPAPPHQQVVAAAPGVVQNPYAAMANVEMQLAQERQRQQYLQAQLLQIQQAREAAQAVEAARAAQAIRADLERQNAIRRRQALMQAALQPPVPRRRARDAPARPARPEWH